MVWLRLVVQECMQPLPCTRLNDPKLSDLTDPTGQAKSSGYATMPSARTHHSTSIGARSWKEKTEKIRT